MADAASALTSSLESTTKISGAVESFTEQRDDRRRSVDNATHVRALDHSVRAQIDEVFLVLALLGEALLPLRVFDNTYYPQTLADVEASILSGGHDLMPVAFRALSAELQYAVTSGLAFCSCFAPIPVYRGFGAAVLNDWDWGCPDYETMVRKMKAKTSVWRRATEKQDPQPNRAVLEAFDQVVQMLQVKQVAFLAVKPAVSGFAAEQPRFVPRKTGTVKKEISMQEEWSSKVLKLGHPAPPGVKVSTWGMPFATWTSPSSCQLLNAKDSFETIMTNQMDPGRLLHAFVCRRTLDVGEGHLLVLPAHSPAESLACWLEGRPGTTHRILKWKDLETEVFEKKCGKSLRKQLGQYPLPEKFVLRNPAAPSTLRPAIPSLPKSPIADHVVSPPPYSPDFQLADIKRPEEAPIKAPAAVELATGREPIELDSTPSDSTQTAVSATAALKPARQIHHAASTSALLATRQLSSSVAEGVSTLRSLSASHGASVSEGVSTLRSLTGVRRQRSAVGASPRHPTALTPGLPPVPPKIVERPVSAMEDDIGTSETPSQLPDRPVSAYIPDAISMPDGPAIPSPLFQAVRPLSVPSVVVSMPDETKHAVSRLDTMAAELSADVPSPAELPSTTCVAKADDRFIAVATSSTTTASTAVAPEEGTRSEREEREDVGHEPRTGEQGLQGADMAASADVVPHGAASGSAKPQEAKEKVPRKGIFRFNRKPTPKLEPEPEPEPKPVSKPEPKPETNPEPEPKPEPKPETNLEPQPVIPAEAPTRSVLAAASTDIYLDLLNKVARGEISPQALKEMLASNTTGSEAATNKGAKPGNAT
ncbi:hypothetical protein LTR53_001570 [Teratosphaeriaceae sp. CCFEE 6253]|nr:hypothetical protein LTR53_001570 [Teratosphaeriaceae sp. CCFEE 6253]